MTKLKRPAFKTLKGEQWKEIKLKQGKNQKRYSISDLGRIASFKTTLEEGQLLKARPTQGYPSVTITSSEGKHNLYIHRLVGEYFCKPKSKQHIFVLHKDHKKDNNKASNLIWATQEEQINHARKDPNVLKHISPLKGPKLTADRVRLIKTDLFKSKEAPTLKKLAKKYRVSDMQIHRIKVGENWGHVKV
ncbi:MAG: hypothetical protein EBR30_12475 [Cytophagia bacterium]|nr:hypothetical protein [Cytophagia bacterium]